MQSCMQRRMRVRILALLVALTLAPLLALPLVPAREASAQAGSVWDSRAIYFGMVGNGGAVKYELYGGRSGHIRLWYRHRTNPGSWYAQNLWVAGCGTPTGCTYQAEGRPPMWDTWNWIIDHADLISNDDGGYAGGYIIDAGPY